MRKKMATSGLVPEAKYPYCGTDSVVQASPTSAEKEVFAAATKIDVADAVKHLRNWVSYIDDHHRQKYADLMEAQAKLIAWLIEQRRSP
jgi:hypothetical protein